MTQGLSEVCGQSGFNASQALPASVRGAHVQRFSSSTRDPLVSFIGRPQLRLT